MLRVVRGSNYKGIEENRGNNGLLYNFFIPSVCMEVMKMVMVSFETKKGYGLEYIMVSLFF